MTYESESGWISVEDRLPKSGAEVDFYAPEDMVRQVLRGHATHPFTLKIPITWWERGGTSSGDRMVHPVTHWRPLPEPPGGECE